MAVRETIFSPAFGNRPSYLVGREAVLQTLLDGLSSAPGSRERAVVMLGQRGMGKTVLLWELADRAREQGFVVANPTVASSDMLERMIEKLQEDGERVLGAEKAKISGANIGALGFSAGLQFTREVQESKSFQYKLTQLARKLSSHGKGVLLLVDELQANSPEVRQLVIAYQELVGEGLDIALVMAGLPGAVSATLNDKVLTFLNRATKSQLEGLSIGDVDAFYARSFKKLGMKVGKEVRRTASEATQGSPYMLQLVGHHLAIRADDAGELDADALGDALFAAKEEFKNDICGTTLAALSDGDRGFLAAMAADEGASRISVVAERMQVEPDYAQKYRKRLVDAGVIASSGWGQVDFAVPFLAEYLKEQR